MGVRLLGTTASGPSGCLPQHASRRTRTGDDSRECVRVRELLDTVVAHLLGALHRLLMTGGGVVATAVARGTRCRALGSLPRPWIVRRVGVARRVLGQPGDRGRQPMPGPRRQGCAAAGICTKVPAPDAGWEMECGARRSNAAASYERDVSTVQRAPGRECPRMRRQREASRVPKVPIRSGSLREPTPDRAVSPG
jgi:hypothetical protein